MPTKCALCPRTILPGQPHIGINEEIKICQPCMVQRVAAGSRVTIATPIRVEALAVATFEFATWRTDLERELVAKFRLSGFFQVGLLLISLAALTLGIIK